MKVMGGCLLKRMSFFSNLFKKKVPPDEMVKEWRKGVRHEMHAVDREIRSLERSENKVKLEIKKLAKAGEIDTAKMLAKVIMLGVDTSLALLTCGVFLVLF